MFVKGADDVSLHVVVAGSGPLLLFLHGFPECWYSWRHQVSAFSARHTVALLDMRGFGLSDKPSSLRSYGLDTLVEDVRQVVLQLGFGRGSLVCHDWGAVVGWSFAMQHPSMLRHFIPLSIPHPCCWLPNLTLRQALCSAYIAFFQLPLLPELYLTANRDAMLRWLFKHTKQIHLSQTDIDFYVDNAHQPQALTAMLNYYRNIPYDFRTHVGLSRKPGSRLSVPTLLIWGEDDPILQVQLTRGIEKFVTTVTVKVIENCGHWVQMDAWPQVNRFIADFIGDTEVR
eukprot:GILK01011280.1.p1 GENE.GILK01011280.1~~GILK01011280.1.p1  ORF type:complete len:285 (+),score=42.83 GILK01011280.1:276-1130(+)